MSDLAILGAPRIVIAALLLGLVGPAFADETQSDACPDEAETTLRGLLAANAGTKSASRGELRQLICTPLARAGKGHVAALANFVESRTWDTGDVIETYTVVLAELGPRGERAYRQTVGRIESDAILAYGPDSFAFEAQWEDVGPQSGAVGVASSSSALGPSAPNGTSSDFFALLVPDGDSYAKVLDLPRYRQESIEGCLRGMCPGSRWTNTATTLTPGERDAEGWRHIHLRLDSETLADDPAVAVSAPQTRTMTLAFKAGRYALPDGSTIPGSEASLSPW